MSRDEYAVREAALARTHKRMFVGPPVDGAVIGYVQIFEPFEVRQTWETACNYTRHEVQPGVYPVRLSRRGSSYVLIGVDTIVREHYAVSRLLQHSTSRTEHPNEPGRYCFQLYEFNAAEAALEDRPMLIGGDFALAHGWAVITKHTTIGGWVDESDRRHHTSRRFVQLPADDTADA